MPWNDNSDGGSNDGPGKSSGGNPWGTPSGGQKSSGPQSPWGAPPPRRPGGNGEQGNLDDLARKVEDRLRNVLGGGGPGGRGPTRGGGGGGEPIRFDKRAVGALGLVFALGWLATGVYVVDAGEEAVITRFGKFTGVASQGLQFHLPAPIERHQIVNVQSANSLRVGAGAEGEGADGNAESGLMLTGDENIVDVGFEVFWRVENSQDFLFNVAHGPDGRSTASATVRSVAEAAMREVVGRSQREQVLTSGRAVVESQTRELIQRTLNQYRAGIIITQVNLRKAEPPAAVIAAFREVAAASQEAETKINQARSYRNAVVPQAQGEAARFNQLFQEYRLAPDVTRQRLYLETMERVYERANKVLLDTGRAGASPMVVLPPELLRGAAPAAPAAPAAQQGGR
jgi:membrane protease subunit HflK